LFLRAGFLLCFPPVVGFSSEGRERFLNFSLSPNFDIKNSMLKAPMVQRFQSIQLGERPITIIKRTITAADQFTPLENMSKTKYAKPIYNIISEL